MQRSISLTMLTAALLLAGCKPDSALKKAETLDQKPQRATPAVAPAAPADAGAISGTVKFNGKPPAHVSIDMSMDPACSMAGDNMTEQYIVNSGKLANVFVYVKAGAPASQAAAGTPPAVLDQKGCRYTPHMIAVQQGGTVEFTNSDPTMHNVHTTPANSGNASLDVSQGPMGQPQTRQFNAPELMLPVRCNNHPWMQAFINVAPNPYFAVSSADGSFTIHGLPPGKYTLAAVHEKLGEQDTEVTVRARSSAQTSFTFTMK